MLIHLLRSKQARPKMLFLKAMRIVLTCSMLLCSVWLRAQGNVALEANLMAGKVLKHSFRFRPPVPDLSTAVDVALVKQTIGTQAWEQRRHYPVWGVGATYTNYGIDSIYGSAFSLYPFLQTYIIRGKRLEWTLRAGLGIGYATKHYSHAPDWDTLNNVIGSAINNFTLIATDLRYRISSHWSVQAGLNFSHLSNGAIRQPNLGINMYGGHLGLRYRPAGAGQDRIVSDVPHLRNRLLVQARIGWAIDEKSGVIGGPIYPVYLASGYLSKRYKGKNKVFLGLDYSYHTRIYAFQRNNEVNVGEERAHSWKSAVFLGHEWLLGRMSFLAQVGYYVRDAVLKQDPYYEKLGYNFYLLRGERGPLKELCLSALLKTHQAAAELVEFGIGVGF